MNVFLHHMTLLSHHGPEFDYSLIGSLQGERGFESIYRQEGGALFTLVVFFVLLSFCGRAELILRKFVSGDKRMQRYRLGPTPLCLFVSPAPAQTLIAMHLPPYTSLTPTHISLACAYFSLSEGSFFEISSFSSSSLLKESSMNKGEAEAGLFCLGCCPHANFPFTALLSINVGPTPP